MPLCPHCHIPVVTEREEVPWCQRCEFNLAWFGVDSDVTWPYDWLSVKERQLGFASAAKLATAASPGHRWTAGLITLLGVSGLIYGLGAALLAVGIWCLVDGQTFFGVVLGLLSLVFLPRLSRVKTVIGDAVVTKPENRPAFFHLLHQVAAATGTPAPDVVAFSYDWNAMTAVVGLRRRRVLVLGIPMWAALTPQERVALLGHELGHLANEDSTWALLTQPALTQFGRMAQFFLNLGSLTSSLWALPYKIASSVLGMLLWYLHLGLNILGSANSRRIELRADLIAARVGGTRAALSTLDAIACTPELSTHISAYAAEGSVLQTWRESLRWARENVADRLPRLRQLSNRDDASLFSSHPAAGRRHQFLGRQPYQDPAVVLSETGSERIDRELGPYAEKFRREHYELVHGI